MQLSGNVLFLFVIATLVFAPVIAGFCAWYLPRIRKYYWHVYVFLGVVTVLVSSAYLFRVAFYRYDLNILSMCAAYFCFAVLALSAFRLQPKGVGWLVGTLLTIPLLLGVFGGTVGSLGVAFAVGDSEPIYIERLDERVACSVTAYGGATVSKNGIFVALWREAPLTKYLYSHLRTVRYVEPEFSPAQACRKALRDGG